jgi:5-methylthioadenosine/S-adenosylhomocysteine deaminase
MRVDLLVLAPHVLTMAGDGVGYRAGVAMAVDRGRIVDLGDAAGAAERYRADETLSLPHHLVLPGLIDAHLHTGCCILRGLAQDTRHWMMYGLQPFDNAVRQEDRDTGSLLAILEAVQAGTTTLGDYGEDMEAVCAAVERIGVRGHLTQLIREVERRVYGPDELYPFTPALGRQLLDRNLSLYDRWNGRADGRIRILFGPQAADFLSEPLLQEVRRAAVERGARIHMHVQQGDRETRQIMMRYGRRPIAWLGEIGFLDEHLIAVHLTDADDREAAEVARSGAAMILCPGSIGLIDGILPPAAAFQAAGGRCGLGTDQAAGNNGTNMFNEMKAVCLFTKLKHQDPELMPAWRALRMATIENARAIGLGDQVGSLEAGKRADFIAVDLRRASMLPVHLEPMRNLVPNLVYSARGPEVVLAAVDGRVIMRDGEVAGIDREELCDRVNACARGIGERAAREFREVDGVGARFMRMGRL